MTLRKAEPQADQAFHFARLAQIASHGIITQFLANQANPALESMFLQLNNENSHAYTYFLQQDSKIAGMIQSYPASAFHAHEWRNLWLYAKYSRQQFFRGIVQLFLLRQLMGYFGSSLKENDFFVGYLAIYPSYRGQGHSKILLNQAERMAHSAGCARLVLDVYESNTVAIAVYLRYGFVQINQSEPFAFQGEQWRVLSLAKPLAPTPPQALTAPAR